MERRLKVGHTGITWADEDVCTAIATISKLGYHGVEVFGWTLDTLEKEGKLDVFEENNIPLISAYYMLHLATPSKFEESKENGIRWGKLMQRLGAKYICMGGEGADRRTFDYRETKDYVVKTVNEFGRIFTDMGLTMCVHPHTGTTVQTEEEIRALMDNIDPRYVGFAPDVAQIQKGGTDAVQIVKDYAPIIRHIHLKDYDGVPLQYTEDGREIDSSGFVCYTPLGQGVVDLDSILNIIEASSSFDNMIMVELDGGKVTPIPQEEALTISRDYLIERGYKFRNM